MGFGRKRSDCLITRSVLAGVAAITCAPGTTLLAQVPPPLGYNIKTLSFTGPGYEFTDSNGMHRYAYGYPLAGNDTMVIGTSSRLASSGARLGEDVWFFDGASSAAIVPSDSAYSYAAPEGTYRSVGVGGASGANNIYVNVHRWSPTGAPLGRDALHYNGSSFTAIGPSGGAYEYNTPDGVVRWGGVDRVPNSTTVIGNQGRYATDGASIGVDLWAYNGSSTQVINPTGGAYEYTDGAGATHREAYLESNSSGIDVTAGGQVLGVSMRFSPTGADLGQDHFHFNGSTTTVLGLIGGAHEYTDADGTHRRTDSVWQNESGNVVGHNLRYAADGSDLGSDAWYFNGTTTQQVGFTGGIYEYNAAGGSGGGGAGGVHRESYVTGQGASGHVAGNSLRFAADGSDLGADSWIYHNGTYAQTGLTGPDYQYNTSGGGVYHSSSGAHAVNAAGRAMGNTLRFASNGTWLGRDTWIYDGTQTRRISLSGPGYEYNSAGGIYRDSDGGHILTEGGKAGGSSTRYASDGTELGNDSFVFDGTNSLLVNPTGGVFDKNTADGIYRSSRLDVIDDDLDVAMGTALRYALDGSSLGQAGYYFDLAAHENSLLQFSFGADGFCYTDPMLLTDEGVVLGSYDKFDGSTNLGRHLFWWSKSAGFYDMGSLVNGGWTSNGFERLYNPISASGTEAGGQAGQGGQGGPNVINGWGLGIGQYPDNLTFFQLQAQTPEPGSAMLVLFAPGLLLCRRRRR